MDTSAPATALAEEVLGVLSLEDDSTAFQTEVNALDPPTVSALQQKADAFSKVPDTFVPNYINKKTEPAVVGQQVIDFGARLRRVSEDGKVKYSDFKTILKAVFGKELSTQVTSLAGFAEHRTNLRDSLLASKFLGPGPVSTINSQRAGSSSVL